MRIQSVASLVAALVLSSLPLTAHAATTEAQTPAEIVMMLDLSGSINYSATPVNDLENEKNAARSLLAFFAKAPVKPRVAIGTFNACLPEVGEPECDNLQARILPNGSLTSDYGTQAAGSGLFGVLNGITRTKGYTDLSQAISVARQHLASQSTSARKYIVIITDGVPNRPGGPDEDTYGNCNACGCATAYDAASAAALAAKNQGINIFTVHYTGHDSNVTCPSEPATGEAFLKESVATSPALYFEGDGGLTDTFSQVAFAITCDNGDPCKKGVYNSNTGICEQQDVTTDTDADGVLDCHDKCKGNDALLSQACSAGEGVCAVSGTWQCGISNAIVCSGVPVDNDTCFGCTHYDVTSSLAVLNTHFKEVSTALRKLSARLSKFAADRATKKLAKKSLKQGNALKTTSISTLATLPVSMANCSNANACVRIGNESTFGLLKGSATEALRSALRVTTKLRKLKQYSKSDRKLLRRIQFLNSDTATITASLPQYQSSCSIKGS